ncbi:MAG: PD40 domain-containing protein [Phycisphaerales bacterium]|nr:MAG: PD40 domain-containing protein [Phycisphaerales bacterium]
MRKRIHALIGFAILLPGFGMGGCAEPESAQDEQLTIEPRPMLSASRDAQITLFGELPDRGEIPFYSRGATSLLRHTFTEEGADFDPNVDPTGERMVFASTRHTIRPDLYVKNVDGTAVTQLTADPSSDVQPAFSPDGRRVAFASDRAGNWDIWVVGVDGTQPTQITRGPEDEVHPSWSPDGKQVVFCSLPPGSGQWEVWIADATAAATKSFIGYGVFPEWCPTHSVIAFQRARQRGSRWFSIWTVELVQGEPRHPTEIASSSEHALINPSWSPDGQKLTYCTVRTAPASDPDFATAVEIADVWIVNADGRSRTRLTDGHSSNYGPVWSNQGRIFFTSTRGGHENIWSLVPGQNPARDVGTEEGVISQGSELEARTPPGAS